MELQNGVSYVQKFYTVLQSLAIATTRVQGEQDFCLDLEVGSAHSNACFLLSEQCPGGEKGSCAASEAASSWAHLCGGLGGAGLVKVWGRADLSREELG